jgi:hypothetical protein
LGDHKNKKIEPTKITLVRRSSSSSSSFSEEEEKGEGH